MKKALLFSLSFLISFVVLSQKVTVQVIKSESAGLSGWKILDENYYQVFAGSESFRQDTVTFSLDANKRFILEISVFEIFNKNSDLYILRLNDEPVILIKSDMEPGNYTYGFFTGIRNEEVKITGGTSAPISDFPWQVYFISGNFRCGGSIISPNWVVTAAHCTQDDLGNPIPVIEMMVRVGSNDPIHTNAGQLYNVSNIIVNSGYNNQTLLNDIALLHIASPINTANANPIKLVTSTDVGYGVINPGIMTWVTGWGLTKVTPQTFPTTLQKVQLPIITNAVASLVWGTIPVTDIMAGYLNGNMDACNGDSGGPMVVPVISEYKLAGIVSWGSDKCNTYGGYTRVSAFEDWIRTNTGIIKEYWPPTPAGDTLICAGTGSSNYSINNLTGATSYEWQVLPSNAGVVSGTSPNATIFWNTGFTGTATLALRVTINSVVSEWSRLNLKIEPGIKFISKSADTTLCAGQPVTLSISAIGYNLNYNWLKNGTSVQSGHSAKLVFSPAAELNTGVYTCQITGFCGTISSPAINLTVYPATRITSLSSNSEVPFGNDVTLQVNSQGHDVIYEWQKDGIPLDNTNTSQLLLQDLNASNIGLYKVKVAGTCGTVTSDSVYVYVKKQTFSGEPDVFLWPSVTLDEFNIALSNDAVYNVSVYNTAGKVIREITNCQYQIKINIGKTGKGTYIVTVFNGNFHKSLKLIKE